MEKDRLFDKIDQAPNLSFGTVVNASGNLLSKVIGHGLLSGLLLLLSSVLTGIVCFIPYIFTLLLFGITSNHLDFHLSNDDRMVIVSYVFGALFLVLLGAIFIAFSASFCRLCKLHDFRKAYKNDYYFYLKKKYIAKLLKLSLLAVALIAPSVLFLWSIPLVYIMIPIVYFSVVFAFNPELSTKDIISVAFKLGTDTWLLSFGVIFIIAVIAAIAGAVSCGVGYSFMVIFAVLPLYVIYKNSIGFEGEEPEDLFGDSFDDHPPQKPETESYDEKTALIIQKINELDIRKKDT